jgi:hypothetical protein
MAGLFEYGIGGNEVKPDASEAINAIPENRTLLCQKLTDDESLFPETVNGLSTVEDVFRHFKPNVDVSFEDHEGSSVQENLTFRNVGDFTVKKLTERSPFLTDLNVQQEQYSKITKQLKTNKVLRSMLENGETREAFVSVLQALIAELQPED